MRSSTPTPLRIASLIVGAVLLLAGVTKTLAPQAFRESLSGYGLPQPLGVGVALVLPAIEILLGVMLLALWARSLGGVLESWQRSVLAGIGFGVLVCTGILQDIDPNRRFEIVAKHPVFGTARSELLELQVGARIAGLELVLR